MVVIEHVVHGSGHAEDAFYHYANSVSDFDFCCLAEVADSRKPEHVEVFDVTPEA